MWLLARRFQQGVFSEHRCRLGGDGAVIGAFMQHVPADVRAGYQPNVTPLCFIRFNRFKYII